MNRWTALALVLFGGLLLQVAASEQPQRSGPVERPDGLCATFVLSEGSSYRCEEYVVETSDGFILGMQRMYNNAASGNSSQRKPFKPVFLYHGLLSGGDSWLLNPSSNSLPFMLVDVGYEVWIGNTRTTNHSGGHVTMTSKDHGFWDWSLDELAGIDVPAMLNLVFERSRTTIHYIGFSQGMQALIAAFSEGQLLSVVDKAVLLAPVVNVNSVTTVLPVVAGLFLIDQMMLLAHVYEFNQRSDSGHQFMDRICSNVECYNDFVKAFAGPSCCINTTRRAYFDEYATQPTSMKNLAQLAQQVRGNSFAKYDYGFLKNLELYDSIFLPSYDVSAIPSRPLLLIHGGRDGLADVDDVNNFVQELTFTPEVTLVPNFGHLDFMLGTTANVEVYSKVIRYLAL